MTDVPRSQTVAHFAVNVDDVDEARAFYAAVLGWTFEPWGPPGFFHVLTADGERPGPIGAIQARRDLDGPIRGFECTVAVDDVAAAVQAAVDRGGRVLMEPTTITGVGELAWLEDPSGNPFGAMRYDTDAR
jgi:predicted enzyme related to lactoylglutathione lyase